eukprot:TRINITY_DN14619_c1_g1_i1.p1 TRINITY_DN14619_c1_g1~~TRINITY_DN14619_c1_g1_i1.p1  ORF type:complete len:143 (-),score=29.84 TRINITY_DN14619_c1_g1_i1:246-674(-)
MQEFTFETSTDKYNGMGGQVVSAKRADYGSYDRALIDNKITALQTKLDKEVKTLEAKVKGGGSASGGSAAAAASGGSSDDDDKDSDAIVIVALVVSIFSILISTCATCVAMKAAKSRGGGSLSSGIGATSYGQQDHMDGHSL